MRTGFLLTLGAGAGYLAWTSLQAAAHILVLVIVAGLIAAGLDPLIRRLEQHGVRRGAGTAVAFTAVLALLATTVALLVPAIARQATQLASRAPNLISRAEHNPGVHRLDQHVHFLEALRQYLSDHTATQAAASALLGAGQAALSSLADVVIVTVLALYIVLTLPKMKTAALALTPAHARARTEALTEEILRRVGGYLAGMVAVSTIGGIASCTILMILGVPYALPLAVVVATCSLVPLVGNVAGLTIASLIAASVSPELGLLCAALHLGYHQLENYLIAPRIMRRTIDLPILATLVAVLVGAALLGVVGALLATPVAAVIQLCAQQLLLPRLHART